MAASSDEETEPLLAPTGVNGEEVDPTHSVKETVYRLFQNKKYVNWFIFQIIFATQSFCSLFLPLYAADYFGGCLKNDGRTVKRGCDPDYDTYAYYGTLFYSIGGAVCFLTSAFVGNLSDRFGRKPFFFLVVICWAIPRVFMIFDVNFLIFMGLCEFENLNGGDIFFVASKAYLADIIEDENDRLVAYGFGESSCGIGVIFGAIIAVVIAMIWDDYTIFIALAVLYGFMFVYIYFFIDESLLPQNRQRVAYRNPFKPLTQLFNHDLILYLSMLALTMAIVEAGILPIIYSYIGNEFNLDRTDRANTTYAIVAITMAIAIIMSIGLLLVFLRNRTNLSELSIMIIAIAIKISALACAATVSMFSQFHSLYVIYVASFLYGTSFFIWPCIDGLLSRHVNQNDQGTAFGIVDAYRSIALIIAPFSFGYAYVALDKINIPYVLFFVAIGFCIVSMFLVTVPLKNLLTSKHIQIRFDHADADADEEEIKDETDEYVDVMDAMAQIDPI